MREYNSTITERIRCERCQKLYATSDGSDCPFCSGEATPAEEDPGAADPGKGSDFFGGGPGFTLADIQSDETKPNEPKQADKQTAKNSKKKEADPK